MFYFCTLLIIPAICYIIYIKVIIKKCISISIDGNIGTGKSTIIGLIK